MVFKLRNIKDVMSRKYGTGEYSRTDKSKKAAMKPGESKFQYDVRMRKEVSRRAMGADIETPDPKSEIKGGFSTAETYTAPLVNPNDLRSTEELSNFGIIPGMSFGEAFVQAGKGDAQAGKSTFFWIDPDLEKNPEQKEKTFLYDFADKETKISPHLPKGY